MAGCRLFISYSRSDQYWVAEHLDALRQAGFDPWYDDEIHAGSDWRDVIADEIERSQGLLFLISDRSIRSERCREELDFALDLGKPVISVLLEETNLPSRLRFRLARRQAILAWRDDEASFVRRLAEARRDISASQQVVPDRATRLRRLRLAVLPFRNASGDAELEYLSDGLTEDLINHLGRAYQGRAEILARSSVMAFKGQPAGAIGAELEADAVVEGGIQHEAGRVRLRVSLIRTDGEVQIWGDAFDGRLDGVGASLFDVQDALARGIAEALELPISMESRRPKSSTISKAKDAYLKGKFHWYSHAPDDFRIARSYFEEALRLDPDFAPAYVGLADAIATPAHRGQAPARDVFPEAIRLIDTALSLDAELPEANDLRARIAFTFDHDWEAAGHGFQRAIETNPSYPDAFVIHAQMLGILGDKPGALERVTRGLNLDPHNIFFRSQLGLQLTGVERFEEALEVYEELPDASPLKTELLWGLHYRLGNYPDALRHARRLLAADETASDVLAAAGESAGSYRDLMLKVARVMEGRSSTTYVSPAFIARLLTHADQLEEATSWLTQAFDGQDSYAVYVGLMPEYWRLWQTDGYRKLAAGIGIR